MESLASVLSLDGLHVSLTTVVQDRLLRLRLVSRKIKLALESNIFIKINIHINDAGFEGLKACFVERWHGRVHLHCTRPWDLDSQWFKEIRDALKMHRLRPLSLLHLSVQENNLHQLVEALSEMTPAIQQLEIEYLGNGTELRAAAAPLASFGPALTMQISIQGMDPGGDQTSSWLEHLLASSISICAISFRTVR
jgi:hypothetical protein